jgi:glyoxylase-like metal-dependent hydrolase (beta-lactamase superfamily II)
MKLETIKLASATITPIFEIDAGQVIQDSIPDARPETVRQIAWLKPRYADENGKLKAQVQAFLVEVGDKKVVVDACCGDGRNRPGLPEWGNLRTGFMERFKKVWQPEEVEIVLCTHMHFDHVGWNTTSINGKWIPTFPNAQYIFSEREFNYWNGKPKEEMEDDRMGFAESVLPVYEAGLARLVPDDYRVTDCISLIPTPGHTPGHVAILLEADGQSAVISGDALHHPCQIAHPEWGTPFDTSTEQANKSRRELLERFADTDTLFIGAHFVEPMAGKIKRTEKGFELI